MGRQTKVVTKMIYTLQKISICPALVFQVIEKNKKKKINKNLVSTRKDHTIQMMKVVLKNLQRKNIDILKIKRKNEVQKVKTENLLVLNKNLKNLLLKRTEGNQPQ